MEPERVLRRMTGISDQSPSPQRELEPPANAGFIGLTSYSEKTRKRRSCFAQFSQHDSHSEHNLASTGFTNSLCST
jgi:hypothetical protein